MRDRKIRYLIFGIILTTLLLNVSSKITFANDQIAFEDIIGHWAQSEIETMIKDDAIGGYQDGTFKPNKEVTLAEFLKMLIEESGIKISTIGKRWPDWYINTAIDRGYINDNVLMNPDELLNRKDACKILANYINVSDVKVSKKKFDDVSKENKDIILKLVNLGIINGYEDGTFREKEYVTRAQACKMILQSIDARIQLNKKRKFELNHLNTNIGDSVSGDIVVQNRYEILKNRIYITDTGRYGSSSKLTMNQEYVNDSKVINVIKSLVDDDSYTEVLYVPDKYIINSLNICYGQREDYVNNGIYTFQIRFYENGKYDVAKSSDTPTFSNHAFAKIQLDRMWDRKHELDNEYKSSDKNLEKLEEAIGALLDKNVKKDVMKYIKTKIVEANSLPDDEFEAKILESKKIGKYKIDVMCTTGTNLQIFFSEEK